MVILFFENEPVGRERDDSRKKRKLCKIFASELILEAHARMSGILRITYWLYIKILVV